MFKKFSFVINLEIFQDSQVQTMICMKNPTSPPAIQLRKTLDNVLILIHSSQHVHFARVIFII